MWVVKLDANGNKVWQKTLGGSNEEWAYAIVPSPDGGFAVTGYTYSTDGDVTGNHGDADMWVVKLDGNGKKLWQKTLGGSGEEYATAITTTPDGGYAVAGHTYSSNGDVAVGYGNSDMWVVRLDGSGNLVWQKTCGGPGYDDAYGIAPAPDGGYTVAGFTNSKSGDVTVNHGGYDFWVVKLGGNGAIMWQKTLGGTYTDKATAVTVASNGGFAIAGYSASTDGDVTGNHGSYDFWVVKLQ